MAQSFMLRFHLSTPKVTSLDHYAFKIKELEDRIADALAFMDACGITSDFNNRLYTVNFWTSHEALHLPFEESMTRVDSTTGEYHDTSAHFVWIGDRTRPVSYTHLTLPTSDLV